MTKLPIHHHRQPVMPSMVMGMVKKDYDHANHCMFDCGLSAVDNYKSMTGNKSMIIDRLKTKRQW